MQQLLAHLAQLGVPSDDPVLAAIHQYFEPLELARGEYFQQQGRPCQRMGFLYEGMISHFYYIDGKERTRWVSLDPSFVTSLGSFMYQTPCLDNLKAIAPARLYVCGRADFYRLKAEHPILQQLWTINLEQEVAGYEYRVYQLITTNAEKRYLDFVNRYPDYLQRLPQKYLADMLGIEPRHLSRIRKKLASPNL